MRARRSGWGEESRGQGYTGMTTIESLQAAFVRKLAREPALAALLVPLRAYYLALAEWVAQQAGRGRTLTVGLNGAQGSGKSTLVALLRDLLEDGPGLRTVVLSIDDFYATRAERQALARDVHPLLATRGVPGTHDIELARHALLRLRGLRRGQTLALPRFVKAQDDRAQPAAAAVCEGPVDVVLFEGWCVGTPPQDDAALAVPVNTLEATEDPDVTWRRYVNDRLRGPYADVFGGLDGLVFLQAPSFDVVHAWRLQQEAGNAAQVRNGAHVMSSADLHRFIAHYERLTRHALHALPARADVVLALDNDRCITTARYR